jgi:hypothetical protein
MNCRDPAASDSVNAKIAVSASPCKHMHNAMWPCMWLRPRGLCAGREIHLASFANALVVSQKTTRLVTLRDLDVLAHARPHYPLKPLRGR